MNDNYLDSTIKQFEYYKMLGEKTFSQLDDDALFYQFNEESNSIAAIVKHISGNMLSRWTDFLTTDGEKAGRDREAEFDNDLKDRAEMMTRWDEGWACLFQALETVNEDNFGQTIYIRNQGHSITEAINRQLAHYPYHIGQIVYIGKMLKAKEWSSLSIPRGDSGKFNAEKFSQPQKNVHYTEEYLKNKKP
ncbi:DUF1572 domain-containing protein [Pedobacter cryoconitis]|uniref:DUF1572 domain-containing protein n=1 Tax=Pedobacter cryoconitis TaxID=188932 RepID=A0A7X0J1D2_9SPHI|nr:DUF1572 domain-containing protein [Pedobacter cryoconitis]MBB6499281.1 hypothetical protein [Pedobacter cryoconitis]